VKSKREIENEIIVDEIKDIHKTKQTYGAVNLKAELLEKKGIKASVNRIRRIMKKNDIKPEVRGRNIGIPKIRRVICL